jgi:mRNA interferase HicA
VEERQISSRIFASFPSLRIEQKCSTNANVKGSHFLRKLKAVARRNKLMYRWVAERGSGSHGTLYIGSRFTVVKDLKKEIGPGLLSDMLKQLGIRKEDL